MELTFLGTASAYPTPTRGVSCIIFRNDGTYWMFDCGEASQIQLMKSAIRPGKISRIFISHLHGDHLFGLPGLLCTMSQNFSPENKATLHIYGPVGLRKFIRTSLELSRSILGYKYKVHELVAADYQYPPTWNNWPVPHEADDRLHPNEDEGGTQIEKDPTSVWNVCEDEHMIVTAGALKHWVPSFGYVITEKPKPGKLDVSKLLARGLKPGPWCSKLKAGEAVESLDGELIHPSEVLGPQIEGRKIAILCDTSDNQGVESLCMHANCIVHEATLEDEQEQSCLEKGHSTPSMAGRFAKQVNANQLILTHFSQRYKSLQSARDQGTDEDDCVSKLVTQAKAAFGSESVIAADDLMTVSINRALK